MTSPKEWINAVIIMNICFVIGLLFILGYALIIGNKIKKYGKATETKEAEKGEAKKEKKWWCIHSGKW